MTRRFFTISKPLIVLIFLFCFGVVNAQDTWQKIYQSQYQNYNETKAICSADGDNFYTIGTAFSLGFGFGYFLNKIDSQGDVIWSKVMGLYPPGREGTCIVKSTDNGCVVSGRSDTISCSKINSEGEVEWRRTYDSYSGNISKIINTADGGYLLCGYEDYNNGYILKIDSLGFYQWDRIFSEDFVRRYYHSVETTDGYILCGYIDHGNGVAAGIITKLDKTGQTSLWEHSFYLRGWPFYVRKIIKHFDNYLVFGDYADLVTGSTYRSQQGVVKINNAGTVLDSVFCESPDEYFDTFRDCIKISDNKFALIIYKRIDVNSDSSSGEVRIIDTNGIILKRQMFYYNTNMELESGINFLNNGFVVAGSVYYGAVSTYFKRTYIARLDSNLNTSPISNIPNVNTIINNFQLYQNYPNPFNPSTLIKFSIPKNGIVTLKIYNTIGKEIHSSSKHFLNGINQIEYFSNNLSSGIYFYSLQFEENIQTKKMIFVK